MTNIIIVRRGNPLWLPWPAHISGWADTEVCPYELINISQNRNYANLLC